MSSDLLSLDWPSSFHKDKTNSVNLMENEEKKNRHLYYWTIVFFDFILEWRVKMLDKKLMNGSIIFFWPWPSCPVEAINVFCYFHSQRLTVHQRNVIDLTIKLRICFHKYFFVSWSCQLEVFLFCFCLVLIWIVSKEEWERSIFSNLKQTCFHCLF